MNKSLLVLGTLTTLLTISGVYLAVSPQSEVSLQQSGIATLKQEYEDWKIKFNKNSNSHDEYRFSIWCKTYEEVSKHNKRTDATYKKSMNKFSDITNEEFQQQYLMKPQNSNLKAKKTQINDNVQRNEQQFFKGQADFIKISQPVQNQASCGSCYSFAAAQAIESAYALQAETSVKLSEQQIVSCSQPYGNEGCNGGFGNSSFDYVIAHGLDTEEQIPYVSGVDADVPECPVENGKYFISSYNHITGLGNCLNQQLAAQQQPLYARAYASDWKQYENGIYNDCPEDTDELINHGIGIVGFNTQSDNESENYWIIRNSWGPDWGEDGYMKLAFGNSCSICHDAYQVFV